MTKKGNIFQIFPTYLKTQPWAALGWLWVLLAPSLGSIWVIGNYQLLEKISPDSYGEHLIFIIIAGLIMGLALLPTTFTALVTGYLMGWWGLLDMVFAYSLATCIGYGLGRWFNSGFLEVLFDRNPDFRSELQKREGNLGKLVFFIRISPIVPFAVSNFLFASLKVALSKVLIYGIPGMFPRTVLALLAGKLANDFFHARENLKDPWQLAFFIAFLAFSIWGIWVNWKKSAA